MSLHETQHRFPGITLPPGGWVLTALLVVYIFVGLIGHDPWKHDDAITIGVVFDIVSHGNWLTPELAGQSYPDAPFYYWCAALTAHLFSWLLPLHDAARLASGLFTLLALEFILLAARELYGHDQAAAAPLVLAGSIGFLFHAHEAQPMLAALTAHTAAYWALALMPRRPGVAIPVFGLAVALCFLANGLLPTVLLMPVVVAFLAKSENRWQDTGRIVLALLLALCLVGCWIVPLSRMAPDYLATFWHAEMAFLSAALQPPNNVLRYLNLLLWYAWPALPLAAWTLWSKRRILDQRSQALPIVSFVLVLVILGLFVAARSSVALLLLPPLVLLAVPGVMSLRRGASNAFDWFGMMTFTFFIGVVWIVWCAMVMGWPARLARQVVRLEPGFVGHFAGLPFVFAGLVTLVWFYLIATSPRSPMRGITHWMAGLTGFWVLIAMLWMPWIDYGKSYRPLAVALRAALPETSDCVASTGIPKSILGTLDYFSGVRTVPLDRHDGGQCRWLLVLGEIRNPETMRAAGWRQVWDGKRPGDHRSSDTFWLFRRKESATKPTPLPEIATPPNDGAGSVP